MARRTLTVCPDRPAGAPATAVPPTGPEVGTPTTVHAEPLPAELLDADGEVLTVDGQGVPSSTPARLWFGRGPWASVAAWAGSWPADRLRVVTADGRAHLLALVDGGWWLEATSG